MTDTNKSQSNNPGQEIDPRVANLSGGKKQHWLRAHREEVLLFHSTHSEADTRRKYNILKDETWANLHNPRPVNQSKLTKIERLSIQLQIAQEDVRSSRREIRELKESFNKFVPFIAAELAEKFFIPLLESKIVVPEGLIPERDPDAVAMSHFSSKSAKQNQTNSDYMLCADGTDTYNANHESSNALTKAPTSARANRRGSRKASADRDNPKSKRR